MEIINVLMDSIINFYNFISQNLTIDAAIKFWLLYFFILWGAFIIWIIKDITNRTTNILLQVFSILVVIFLTPIFWLPIYLLMRPRRTIFEKYYEEDEDEEAILEEDEDEEINEYPCPKCGKNVSEEFKFCPYCEFKLVKDCPKCGKQLLNDWKACPYCWNHDINEKKEKKKPEIKIEVEKVENKKKTIKEIIQKLENEE